MQVRIAPGVRRKTTQIPVCKLTSDTTAEDSGPRPSELIIMAREFKPSVEQLGLQKRLLAASWEVFDKARE